MTGRTLKLITIDGPSASGKSSIGKLLAEKLNWPWLSTGVFYRGLALLYLERSFSDPQRPDWTVSRVRLGGGSVCPEKSMNLDLDTLAALACDSRWEVRMDGERTRVFIDGRDRTDEIFSRRVDLMASDVSRIPRVREALLKPQRDCFNPERGLVTEGRDCGTVVFPQARVKVYLTAGEDTRALRRCRQQDGGLAEEQNRGDLIKTLEAQKLRDKQDSTRSVAPLKIPRDSLLIDSTRLSVEEVVTRVLNYARDQGVLF